MPRSWLDHLVITAPSLATGIDYVRRTLGVTPQPGGEHSRMATHNCLVKLGEAAYLEVISANPSARAPDRARWFDLDRVGPGEPARLAGWVARTTDIQAAAAASPVALGVIEPMSRGSLSWLITIPADGSLPLAGAAPALIQWPSGVHPARTLEDQGCRLIRLEAFHPQADTVRGVLRAIGLEDDVSIAPAAPGDPPRLVAHIETPGGTRRLGHEAGR